MVDYLCLDLLFLRAKGLFGLKTTPSGPRSFQLGIAFYQLGLLPSTSINIKESVSKIYNSASALLH